MNRHSVLLVNGEEETLKLLEETFSASQYQVLTAHSGPQALSVMETHPVSLIISDHKMRGMSVRELLTQVRGRWPKCACVLMTDGVDGEVATGEGWVHHCVTGPGSQWQLLQTVASVLESSDLRGGRLQSDTPDGIGLCPPGAELGPESWQARYLDLYHNSPDGYWSFTPDGVIVEVNQTQLSWLGYSREEVVGKLAVSDVLTASKVAPFSDFIANLAEQGKLTAESELIKRDGSRMPVRLYARAAYHASGGLILGQATVRDLSAEKQLLAQLIEAQKIDSVGRLAGGIAHDFNNLLTGILGFTSLAIRQIGKDHDAYQSLAEVERAAHRAARLVAQLLAYSRRQISKLEPLDLNQLVPETAKFLARTLPETIKITLRLSEETSTVKADYTQLQQVILNLCLNARDAMTQGGELVIETGRATLDEHFTQAHLGSKPGAYTYLKVTDTGTGMDRITLQRVFEPFFTTKEVGKGTGLGLAMVYGIVKSHGGYVTAESELGKGSTFQVYLPASGAPVKEVRTRLNRVRGGSETILVVEDEPTVSSLIQKVLADYGYKVLAVANGRDALSTFRDRPGEIDLVITDVVMPEVGGTELHQELKKIDPQVRVLLSTGYSVSPTLKDFIDQGVPFIQKPYQIDDLARTVRAILDSSPEAQSPDPFTSPSL